MLGLVRKAAGVGHGAVGGVSALIIVVAVITVLIDKPAAATKPSPHSSSTTQISPLTTPGAAAPVASVAADSLATAGTDCGSLPVFGEGDNDLIVTTGGISCATAYSVIEAYEAVPDKHGDTQPATVQGWACSQSTQDAFSQAGVAMSCRNGDKGFEAQDPQLASAAATATAQN